MDANRKDISMFHRHPIKVERERKRHRDRTWARDTLYLMPNTKEEKTALHPEGKDTRTTQISDVPKHQQAKDKLQGQKVNRVRWRPEEDPRGKRHRGASRGTRDTGGSRARLSDAAPRVAAAGGLRPWTAAACGCCGSALAAVPEPALPSSARSCPSPGKVCPMFPHLKLP